MRDHRAVWCSNSAQRWQAKKATVRSTNAAQERPRSQTVVHGHASVRMGFMYVVVRTTVVGRARTQGTTGPAGVAQRCVKVVSCEGCCEHQRGVKGDQDSPAAVHGQDRGRVRYRARVVRSKDAHRARAKNRRIDRRSKELSRGGEPQSRGKKHQHSKRSNRIRWRRRTGTPPGGEGVASVWCG